MFKVFTKDQVSKAVSSIDSAITDIKQKAEETSCEDVKISAQKDYEGLLIAERILLDIERYYESSNIRKV